MGVSELYANALPLVIWQTVIGEDANATPESADVTPNPSPHFADLPVESGEVETQSPEVSAAPEQENAAEAAAETPQQTAMELTLTPAPTEPVAETGGSVGAYLSTSFIWAFLALAIALAWVVSAIIRRARTRRKETTPTAGAVRGADKPSAMAIGNLHNIGMRNNQEDSFAISDVSNHALLKKHGLLAVVADGMGGLEDGEAVSAAVTSTFMSVFPELPETLTPPQKLLYLTERANKEACCISGGATGQSGSTLLAALVQDGLLWFASVGDSRICLFRGGDCIQLTREHVYAADLDLRAAMGAIGFDEASGDSQRHALTSYIGMSAPEHIDFNLHPIQLLRGDWVVLMTDGVFNTLNNGDVAALLHGNVHDAAYQIEDAVLRRQAAYQDNFTAVLLQII